MEKLFLIDGMSLVFRAYHAMAKSNFHSDSGEPTYAVFGFINTLHSLIKSHKASNMIVAFDTATPTFRHEKYEQYKANRDEFPEALVPQLKRIKEFLDLAGIRRIEMPGYEADDVIGSMAKQFIDYEVFCITEDKDYYQLVDDRIKLLKPSRSRERDFTYVDLDEVRNKFGGVPEQVKDVLALIGDSSDNIPGVKGIGEKTAIPLIQKYVTLDNLYNNIDEITPPGVKTKLINGKDNAYQAYDLVTILTDLELPKINSELKLPDAKALYDFFAELNFNQFKVKWLKDAELYSYSPDFESGSDAKEEESVAQFDASKVNYTLINDINSLKELVKKLENAEYISVDTETSSLDRMSCDLAGISLSTTEDEAYYIAVKSDNKPKAENDLFSTNDSGEFQAIPTNEAINALKPLLENPNIAKGGQNIKFDAIILKRHGIDLAPITFDSMVAGHLINPDSQLNLDALSLKYLNYQPIEISSLIGTKKQGQKSMTDLDPALISDYASEDADIALKLKNKLEIKLHSAEKLNKLANEVEFPLISVLLDMEYTGVKIDDKGLKEISDELGGEIEQLRANVFKEAGEEFNLDSPKQLGEILFDVMKLPAGKKTKTGYSTDVETLSALRYAFPIADYILRYRQLAKLKSTYVDALPLMINPATGRLHTNYNQTGTNTGRLSSNEPNLQNIPIRSDAGKEVRKAFIGENGNLILSADYSQIELRIMAYFSNDKNLIEAFNEKKDIHSATAAVLNDIAIDVVSDEQRRIAKTVNFGIMYGLGSFGLSQRLGITRNESTSIINNYFEKYPGIKKYMDDTIEFTHQNEYAETLLGRRRYFPEINSSNRNIKSAYERAAINMPIQGTAADLIKIAMLKVHKAINEAGLKSKMIMQVHDELVFECLPEELEDLKTIVKHNMETAIALGDVPIVAELGSGSNWLEAH